MLSSAKLVSFIGVSDLDQAENFYGGALGLQLQDERPFALVAHGDPGMLRITRVDAPARAEHTVLGWAVADIVAEVDELIASGVETLRFDGMAQDERGIWTAPNGTKVAWFADPDGNNLAITQF